MKEKLDLRRPDQTITRSFYGEAMVAVTASYPFWQSTRPRGRLVHCIASGFGYWSPDAGLSSLRFRFMCGTTGQLGRYGDTGRLLARVPGGAEACPRCAVSLTADRSLWAVRRRHRGFPRAQVRIHVEPSRFRTRAGR